MPQKKPAKCTSNGKPEFANFDDYLRSEGVKHIVDIAVEKRLIAREILGILSERKMSKAALARQVGTSRTQIDRVLDPDDRNITLETLKRVAEVLGKRLQFSFVDI